MESGGILFGTHYIYAEVTETCELHFTCHKNRKIRKRTEYLHVYWAHFLLFEGMLILQARSPAYPDLDTKPIAENLTIPAY